MSTEQFVAYVGDPQIHDGRVTAVRESAGALVVEIRSAEGDTIIIKFSGVIEVRSNRPVGMLLYSLSELEAPRPGRLFVFVNWDDDDDAFLEVKSLEIQVRKDSGSARDAV